MSEEEIQAYADELAHKFIIVDGHVDLPYRMEVKGFMLRKEVEDVSVETAGNFDFPKARKGGLDAPFMSIYVPSSYNGGGAKEFADSLLNKTKKRYFYPNEDEGLETAKFISACKISSRKKRWVKI